MQWQTLEICDSESEAGSGTLPAVGLPSIALRALPEGWSAGTWALRLRNAAIPVIGSVRQNMLWLDMRTVADAEEDLLVDSVTAALQRR